MFLRGTVYEDKKYAEKYGYKTKFRLLPTQFGIYGGEKIFEFEEVAITTNTMSFNEYLETRKFTFIVEMIYNSKIFRELEFLLEDYKLDYYDYVYFMFKEIENCPEEIKTVFESLKNQSLNELKDSEDAATKYYSKDDNFEKLESGEEGSNLKFIHKAMLLSKYKDVWLNFVFSSLKKFLQTNNIEITEDFHDIVTFTKNRFDGVLDSNKTCVPINSFFNCDIINWLQQKNRTRPLKEFAKKDKVKIKFFYNKPQTEKREYLFKKFSEDTKLAKCNIVMRTKPQHKLFRNYKYVKTYLFFFITLHSLVKYNAILNIF